MIKVERNFFPTRKTSIQTQERNLKLVYKNLFFASNENVKSFVQFECFNIFYNIARNADRKM